MSRPVRGFLAAICAVIVISPAVRAGSLGELESLAASSPEEYGKVFDKAAVPGGLWLQKQKDVYFCNSGRAADGEMLCWKLRVPVKGQPCQ